MSAKSPIRLVLADVDGTLVTNDKILTDKAVAGARALARAGIILALTSGRPPRGMEMLIKPLALEGAIAGFNGGVFVNPDLSVIETHPLDPDAAKKTLELLEAQKLDAWVYTAKDWLVRDPEAPHVDREAWTVKFDAKVVKSFTDEHLANAIKIVGISDDLDLVAETEKKAQDALGKTATASRSQPYYLDVTDHKANKGEVIAMLARSTGIAPEEMATMGDQPNDVLMFEKSGFSIAMGNSSAEVKASASAVAPSNEDEGFATAITQMILPRAPKS